MKVNSQQMLKHRLNSFVQNYKAKPNAKIKISGHTCDNGSDAYNQALSERRTKSVYRYLVSNGIPKDKIEKSSHGENTPLVANADRVEQSKESTC